MPHIGLYIHPFHFRSPVLRALQGTLKAFKDDREARTYGVFMESLATQVRCSPFVPASRHRGCFLNAFLPMGTLHLPTCRRHGVPATIAFPLAKKLVSESSENIAPSEPSMSNFIMSKWSKFYISVRKATLAPLVSAENLSALSRPGCTHQAHKFRSQGHAQPALSATSAWFLHCN